ncbi:aldo/keto reductase [Arthrobacter sp. A5]|uniref:aldo/keto reductase n=1 Tax=Arthrobacter sp. A5 TaxID=576926 RepID=UPI003DA8764E
MRQVPNVTLNNGVKIGQLGYGVYKVPAADSFSLVTQALEAGYRSIDTAALYANEEGVGQAVRQATGDGGPLRREDIFVTTKVWNDSQGFDSTLAAFDESLHKLELDYVDLYLIHWPCPEQDLYIETYRALERLYHDGRVRAIGVSNFEPEHLRRLLDATDVVPAVNQVELHPWLQQSEVRAFGQEAGIRTEAWSPLARGQLLEDPVLARIAAALGRSVAQVVLRWHVQLGNIVIPKASSLARIRENRNIFDFMLDDGAMADIAALDRGHRAGSDPARVN